MQEEQFWLLVSLKLSGEATEEELATLEAWLQQHPERGLQLETLHNLWKGQAPAAGSRKSESLDRHLQRLNALPSTPRRINRRTWAITGIAASLLAVLLFAYLLGSKKAKPQVAQNTITTKPGSKSKVQLPDGSQVWLNADSRITYDESFRGPFREVKLCGEAYFDIAKDKDHPFIIHASSIDVKVLGTSLNVRSYRNEKNTEAVLINGSIEVSLRDDPGKRIVLQPNEKIVVENDPKPVVAGAARADLRSGRVPALVLGKAHFQQADSLATEVLWIKNKLAFDQETLENVASKIERWYGVKIFIRDDSLKETAYSGVFEDESLDQVMEALRLTGNFRYSINKKEITITR
ncbi:MAG TPA: FecR domain-containing protein [Puia sp.]|jgi:ferric-dicitrate binding protein FerR (iron transport regulator)